MLVNHEWEIFNYSTFSRVRTGRELIKKIHIRFWLRSGQDQQGNNTTLDAKGQRNRSVTAGIVQEELKEKV